MPHYRLAAFDMDGTLLNSDKEIPASAIEACRRAWKAGKILALDTGRAVSELSLYPFSEMGIRYGACACGTVIYDFEARKVLATRTIPKELIPVLVEASRKEDLMFQAMIDGIGYVEAADVERMDHFRMGVYQPLYRATSSFAEDIRAFALENACITRALRAERGRWRDSQDSRWISLLQKPRLWRLRRKASPREPGSRICAKSWVFPLRRRSASAMPSMTCLC